MQSPFFSIIVAAYNAEATIAFTIQSVLCQKFEDFEIIVKDGGSKDNTLECIPKSDKIKVYSSADGGIYEGMNEGIAYASGKYFCFLNCGDIFADENVLTSFWNLSKEYKNTKRILYGDYSRKGVLFKQPSVITSFYLYRTPLCHQSMFFGRELFEELGGYDTTYRILADYNHTLHAFTIGIPFVYCNVPVCDYLGGGASESPKGVELKKSEFEKIQNLYYTKSQRRKYDFKIFLSFKDLRQKLISDKSPKWVRKLYRKVVNLVNK